jgi:hypothetical protein
MLVRRTSVGAVALAAVVVAACSDPPSRCYWEAQPTFLASSDGDCEAEISANGRVAKYSFPQSISRFPLGVCETVVGPPPSGCRRFTDKVSFVFMEPESLALRDHFGVGRFLLSVRCGGKDLGSSGFELTCKTPM